MSTELQRIDPQQNQPLAVRENSLAIGQPLSVTDISQRLGFIKTVMETVMSKGIDYGTIPGCGDKPGLFQPGAQKLCLTFQLNTGLQEEKVIDMANYHREYSMTVRVSSGSKYADGVGVCSTLEAKYRFRNGERKCPACGKPTILKSKKEPEFFCWTKKGGCGATFPDNAPEIVNQQVGRVEHDNPADYWNTVRKIAFKRAHVHATINFTNTSELWSQDLEDIAANGHGESFNPQQQFENQNQPATPKKNGTPSHNMKEKEPSKEALREATDKTRVWMLNKLLEVFTHDDLLGYATAAGIITDEQGLENWPLNLVAKSSAEVTRVGTQIQRWLSGAETPATEAATA